MKIYNFPTEKNDYLIHFLLDKAFKGSVGILTFFFIGEPLKHYIYASTDKINLICFQNGETPGSAETKKARIRGALEASGMAGNLTPDDIQTLKK